MLVQSDKMVEVFSLNVPVHQLGTLKRETFSADIAFARFLPDRPEIFVMGANGTAALLTPGEETVERLPTSHVIPAGSIDSWVSRDGRWIVVRDLLRAVIGYRIDVGDDQVQRMYPLHTPLGTADRAATLGGGLADSWQTDAFAFGRTDTDATVVVPGEDGLAVHIRHLVAHEAPVTGISFGSDARRMFTVDLDGKLRAWRSSLGAFSAVPVVLPLEPESRLLVPDAGNFGALDTAVVTVSPGPPTFLVTGYKGLHAYDIADLDDLSFTERRRKLRVGDLPLRQTPDAAILATATFPTAALALSEGWNTAALLGGRVIISLLPGVTRFDERSPDGRDIAAPDGETFLKHPVGVFADESSLYLFTESGGFCRVEVTAETEATHCAAPNGAAATVANNFVILEVSPTRFVIDLSEVIDVDWTRGTYRVSSLDRPAGFCGTSGPLGEAARYIHFTCDDNVVICDLGQPDPSRFLMKADATVTEVKLDRGRDGALVAVGTSVGSLTAFRLPDASGRNETLGSIATGGFSGPTSIAWIAIRAADETIVTGDSSGNVWRWEILDAQPDGARDLMPAVRLMHHRGTASSIAFIENPADGMPWIVSGAADYKVMLSPLDISSLLKIADKALD